MTKHVVITGANRGIGLEFAKQYLAQGFEVTVVVRKPSTELQDLSVNVIEGIDVSQGDDVARLASALSGKAIDVLINNAGIFENESLANMDFDAINAQLQINAVAPVRVTHVL
jgi:short-subunit dehydrogenase